MPSQQLLWGIPPPTLGWMQPHGVGGGSSPEPLARVTFSSHSTCLRGCAQLLAAETEGELGGGHNPPPPSTLSPCSGRGAFPFFRGFKHKKLGTPALCWGGDA